VDYEPEYQQEEGEDEGGDGDGEQAMDEVDGSESVFGYFGLALRCFESR
jgi:hypothetical protein